MTVLEKLGNRLGRAMFPPSQPPVYQFRIREGSGEPAIYTWTGKLGVTEGAPVPPTCVVDIEAGALGRLVNGEATVGEINQEGKVQAGGLMTDVYLLGLLFQDTMVMLNLAASALPKGQKRALVEQCEAAMLEIGGDREQYRRVSRMIEAWRDHTISICRPGQLLVVDVPDLEVTPWLPGPSLGYDDLLASAFPELREEAQKFVTKEYLAPHYGASGETDEPRGLNPRGWRHLNLMENCEWAPARCAPFPKCREVIETIARETTVIHAGFLILEPGIEIDEHADGVAWALAYSYGLIVPENCYLKVAGESRPHRERQSLLFNDSYLHSAANGSASTRVLFSLVCTNPDFSKVERECLKKAVALLPKGQICYPS